MKTQKSLIALVIASTLTACGGSDSSDQNKDLLINPVVDPVTLSGKAADGYLVGATMCLDINENKECDADEPQTPSTAGGEFTFEAVTQTQIDGYPLLAEIIPGVTEDADNPGVPLTKTYTLSAPAGYNFVSPLTTLVQNEIDKGSTLEEAEALIKDKLATTLSLSSDYIAGADDNENKDQAEFTRLHQVAQIITNIMASNIAALESTATSENISSDKLQSLIANKVTDSLADIVEQVENADDFDADTLAATIDLGITAETLVAQVAQNEAENSAVASDLFSVMQNDSLNWFWGETNGQEFALEYGTLSLDSEGNAQESAYFWDDQWLDEVGEVDDAIESVTLNDDQSITIDYADTTSEIITATEFNLQGLNIALIMEEIDSDGVWSEMINPDVVFPEGAFAYKVNFTSVATQEEYSELVFNSIAREAILDNFDAPEIIPPEVTATTIPTATIDVNGNVSDDWDAAGVEAVLEDAAGDAGIGALDLTGIYLAQDTDNLYLRLDRASLEFPDGIYYNYWIYFESDSDDFAVELYHDSNGVVSPTLWDTTAGVAPGERSELTLLSSVNVGSPYIEVAVPKSFINTSLEYSLSFLTHYSETDSFDGRDQANDDTGESESTVTF